MNKNVLTIIGIVCIIAGAAISAVTGFEVAQISGFAVTMFGAGLAVANMWKNKKEGAKTWLVVLSLVFLGVGAFLAGITGVLSETQVTTIIGFVVSLALIIAGLITTVVANKTANKTE